MPKDIAILIFFVLIFAIPIAALVTSYFMRKLQSQERLKAIEKGVPLPPEGPQGGHSWDRIRDPWGRVADLRLGGLICIAVGIGLVALFLGLAWSLPEFPIGVSAVAVIPFLIGLVLLYEYNVRIRELGPRPVPPGSPNRM